MLVCFAVKEEARFFQEVVARSGSPCRVVLTGMGQRNAERVIRAELAAAHAHQVLSSGFAGGLNPVLKSGDVVFSAPAALSRALASAGAIPGRFHCAATVATTSREKMALRQTTGADAVEMESGVIESVCSELKIDCATVRVILDTAAEDLPLDFNALMTPEQRLDGWKLARVLLRSPGKIGDLLRLQRQSAAAAKRLADVLSRVFARNEAVT